MKTLRNQQKVESNLRISRKTLFARVAARQRRASRQGQPTGARELLEHPRGRQAAAGIDAREVAHLRPVACPPPPPAVLSALLVRSLTASLLTKTAACQATISVPSPRARSPPSPALPRASQREACCALTRPRAGWRRTPSERGCGHSHVARQGWILWP